MKKFCVVMLILCCSCGSVTNKTESASPGVSAPTGDTLVVFNSNFTDPIGNLSTIDLAANMSAQFARITTDGSDAVIRSFGGRVYVVNRYGTDTIQVIDPANFSVIANYSVGSGSNPQDIVVVSDEKAYISRLDAQNDDEDAGDVLIVNPLTGAKLGGIDLTPFTNDDAERLARAAQMILVGDYLYVCMQDLPANMLFPADTNGKVAVIDTVTDEIVDANPDATGDQVIDLVGRNPSDIAYVPNAGKLIIADSGVYNNFAVDTSDSNGGIELVDIESMTSDGIILDDAALGGGVAEVRVASGTLAFTIVGSMTIASFNPNTHEIVSTNVYTTPWRYLPDIAVDSQGRLFVAEQDYQNPGVVVIDASSNAVIAGPIAVGAPPVSMTFVSE